MRVSPSNVSIKARRRFSFGSGPKSKSDCGMEASASGLIPESLSISVSTVPDVQFW